MKKAIVIGATSGIGLEVARLLYARHEHCLTGASPE